MFFDVNDVVELIQEKFNRETYQESTGWKVRIAMRRHLKSVIHTNPRMIDSHVQILVGCPNITIESELSYEEIETLAACFAKGVADVYELYAESGILSKETLVSFASELKLEF